ncbi:MFS monocarboxylate transporter-like protein [Acrodontium crateriforme]|uniref:MFS monocarboxylate transporter-like protein n=1 Tax=Acrodontium crateriforme TaxID=150365 RepID=A0AAQ3LZT5_9PEZI|nr:MFS monocarboxylate transporter-like protein [Acrodontium crateriforme]
MLSEKSSDHSDKLDAREPYAATAEINHSSVEPVVEIFKGSNQTPLVDGGTRAWLQVVGSFLVFSNIWGITFAFGSFQTFYQLEYLRSQTPSNISWIGTVSAFLLIIIGVFTGPLFDLGYFKTLLITGAILETLGVFLLSLSSKYYQIMLCQGMLIGIGNGCLYLPGLALVGRSFRERRSIAMAITSCGAPVGGIAFTLAFEHLINPLGFAWTVRVIGFIVLASYLVAFPLLLWGVSNLGDLASGTKRKLFDKTALRDLPFLSFSFSNMFMFMGYMSPFIYIAPFGKTQLGLSQTNALNMIVIAQATSVVGRMVCGYIAAKVGVMLPWVICGISSGVLCIGWIGIESQSTLVVFAALYGALSGALIPLPPSIFPVVCPNPKVLGTRLGMAQSFGAVGSLIGAPIAGALISVNGGHSGYLGLQLFSGLVMVVGGLILIWLWILLIRSRNLGIWL